MRKLLWVAILPIGAAIAAGAHTCGLIVLPTLGYSFLILLIGFCLAVFGSGCIVARVTGRIVRENGLDLNGLKHGGRLIGQLERALIFLLVLLDQPAGIGFLVAAKSILRFEEARKQPLAEYVLIGTLLSFTLAIAIAAVTVWLLRHG